MEFAVVEEASSREVCSGSDYLCLSCLSSQ